jgi:23S rRNA G2069 N7-methylase RlmK/C1962 C5-methylase RlmI
LNLEEQARMLANRVRKSFRKLQPRFERESIGAFRLYDRDIPEIRAAVDWYEGHLVVAEYEREQTRRLPWLETMGKAAAEALAVPQDRLHLKTRRPGGKYDRLSSTERRLVVRERDLRFHVNLDDYIDTGLFPDHRQTRGVESSSTSSPTPAASPAPPRREEPRRRPAWTAPGRTWTGRRTTSS